MSNATVEISVSPNGVEKVRIVAPSLGEQEAGAELYLVLLPLIQQLDRVAKEGFKDFQPNRG